MRALNMKNMEHEDLHETIFKCYVEAWQHADRAGNEELKNNLYTNPYRPILESLGYDLSFCKKNKEDNS